MPTVVISREPSDEIRAAVKANLPSEVKVVYLHELDQAERAAVLESADVLAFFMLRKELSPEELPLLAKIPMLQSIPAGVEMLPYEHISPDTVLCANTGGWAWPLAEQVMGMVITLDRELISYSKKLQNGVWDRSSNRCLRGRTMGILGFGGIGQATAKLAKAFGMKIMAINRSGQAEMEVDFIGTEADRDQVLAQADVIVLSTPLTKTTRGMIGARELGLMKPEAVLINVGRGPLIDEDALYEHMQNNPDFKFGSDVWWEEPAAKQASFNLKHPFFDSDNVLGTPHNADLVKGMLQEATSQALGNVARYLKGEPLRGLVKRTDYE